MEPYTNPTPDDFPPYLIELSLRQSDGPKSDPVVTELRALLAETVGVFDGSGKMPRDEERVSPTEPEAIAAARKADSILDHTIGQHAAANAERQQHYQKLTKTSTDAEQLLREVETRIAIVVAVEKLFAKGVIALDVLATENAELPLK